MQDLVLQRCQAAIPAWAGHTVDDFDFDHPKGFSSFTMGVRARAGVEVDPPAVLYRQLAGKENAILDHETERAVFLLLGEHEIAAHCYHYDQQCRIEAFYPGRTLTADDVFDPTIQRGIAAELFRLHQLRPIGLPAEPYFELVHDQWSILAQRTVEKHRHSFPPEEQALCDDLRAVYSEETRAMVRRCAPDRAPVFCHNDTYHGNVFLLDDGTVKLLDFEFSCLNHPSFDFANLFAETTMRHGLEDWPHVGLAEPTFDDDDLARLIGHYLAHATFATRAERLREQQRLVDETRRSVMLSDYMYAMAALTLAREPIQKIRFLPYAHLRFERFRRSWNHEFGPGS